MTINTMDGIRPPARPWAQMQADLREKIRGIKSRDIAIEALLGMARRAVDTSDLHAIWDAITVAEMGASAKQERAVPDESRATSDEARP